MANKFLEELHAALENHEPTEEILKDAPEVGNTELESQKKAVDTDGNPEAPGDPEATPVGGKEEDPKVSELPAEKDSSLPNADDVPAPGDENGNPAPATESILGPSKDSMLEASKLSGDKLIAEAIKAYEFLKKKGVDSGRTKQEYEAHKIDGNFDPYKDDADDFYPKEIILKKIGNDTVMYCTKSIETDWQKYTQGEILFVASGSKFLLCSWNVERQQKLVAKMYDKQKKEAAKAQPAAESMEVGKDTLNDFPQERDLHKNRNLIPLQQEKDAQDASGNTGDPAENKQTPVSPSGEPKEATLDKAVQDSYDESGHTETPGVNGTPVSKSGDSKPLPKNEFEKAADDKDGNPEAPGVPGDPAPSFESFIAACEQLVTEAKPGTVNVPESMSLESYAYELGMGEIAARATEAALTAAEKRALKDSDFGLPEKRQWPLCDEERVRDCIKNFHWCPKENQRELAKNILKAMRKFGMKDVEVSEGNPFLAYYPEAKVVARKKPEKKAQ